MHRAQQILEHPKINCLRCVACRSSLGEFFGNFDEKIRFFGARSTAKLVHFG